MATPHLEEGRITREQYWHLVADGTVHPDDRVELLEGVIVTVPPHNPQHAVAISALNQLLSGARGVHVRVQLSLDVSEMSTPEPDLAVITGAAMDYATAHPTTALLVVEVGDGSPLQDRLTKGPIYAAAGIPEYWIVNLRERCIEVYRDPDRGARRYATADIRRIGDRLTPSALAGLSIPVDDVLPPA